MKFALLAVAAVALGGCAFDLDPPGPVRHETQAVELDKSEMARVDINMGAGELNVEGGSPKLMDADFEYNRPSWKPVVRYETGGFRANLTIEQPGAAHGGAHMTYRWKLRLNDRLPVDVAAHLGAGEARLNLGSLALRSVEVHMGVGELRLDLRGKPDRDYSVEVHGGVGHALVYLPRDVGVIATAGGGIGDISVGGLEKHNGKWINPAHEHAPVTIHVNVHGGVGQIQLLAGS